MGPAIRCSGGGWIDAPVSGGVAAALEVAGEPAAAPYGFGDAGPFFARGSDLEGAVPFFSVPFLSVDRVVFGGFLTVIGSVPFHYIMVTDLGASRAGLEYPEP
jgi:hypothetical protein